MGKDNYRHTTVISQMLELSYKDFKAVIIKKCFNEQLQILLKQMEKYEITAKK